ncbi:MAG TPA: carboxypeptidase-like regulatory domain-containing protein [Chryseosolibacter sp.]|nr:carboxypeptidase-like regulatory domain-containing protein [Chryseosolibacter sp.]
MTYKFLLIIVATCALVLFESTDGLAQNYILGSVTDKDTGAPIHGVYILLEGSQTGTITNQAGNFRLSFDVPLNSQPRFIVSCIGYNKEIVRPRDTHSILHIELTPSITVLPEVTVRTYEAKDIVIDAYRKISENYPNIPMLLTGFYRETLRRDTTHYIYVGEAELQAKKKPYENKQKDGQVKVTKGRVKLSNDSANRVTYFAGPHIMHRFDFVIQRIEFISKVKDNDYSYDFDSPTTLAGRRLYNISFKPVDAVGKFIGNLFIDMETGAFAGAEYKLSNTGLRQENTIYKSAKWLDREYKVNYYSHEGKWYLQDIYQRGTAYDNILKDTVSYTTEFVVTDIDSSSTSNFTYDEQLQYRDIFMPRLSNYDSGFWRNHNIILEDSTLREHEGLDRSGQIRKAKISSLRKFLVNLESDAGMGYIQSSGKSFSGSLAYQNLDLEFDVKPREIIPIFFISYNYKLSKITNVNLGFFTTMGGETKEETILSGISYRKYLPISNRPVSVESSLNLAYTVNMIKLASTILDEPITIKDKTFNDKVDIKFATRHLSLMPALKIAVEYKRRMDFFVQGFYKLELMRKHSLVFQQKKNFLQSKKATADISNPEISMSVNSTYTREIPFEIKPLVLVIGCTLRIN